MVAGSPGGPRAAAEPAAQDVDGGSRPRVAFLTAYQNAAYGRRYARPGRRNPAAETKAAGARPRLTERWARNLFKLMAIKDEYEVARLYTDGSFRRQLAPSSPDGNGWSSVSRRRSSASSDPEPDTSGSRPSGRG